MPDSPDPLRQAGHIEAYWTQFKQGRAFVGDISDALRDIAWLCTQLRAALAQSPAAGPPSVEAAEEAAVVWLGGIVDTDQPNWPEYVQRASAALRTAYAIDFGRASAGPPPGEASPSRKDTDR